MGFAFLIGVTGVSAFCVLVGVIEKIWEAAERKASQEYKRGV